MQFLYWLKTVAIPICNTKQIEKQLCPVSVPVRFRCKVYCIVEHCTVSTLPLVQHMYNKLLKSIIFQSGQSAETKQKAAEEGGNRRGMIQLEPSGTNGLCLGITRHSCDKTHAVFVRQPSAAESCKKMGR